MLVHHFSERLFVKVFARFKALRNVEQRFFQVKLLLLDGLLVIHATCLSVWFFQGGL